MSTPILTFLLLAGWRGPLATQFQRDCDLQPKVARNLPWVIVKRIVNRNAVVAKVAPGAGNGRNRVAVECCCDGDPG